MIPEIPIALVRAVEQKEINTFTLGLSECADGSGVYLIFERSLTFSKEDKRAGMATYSLVVPDDNVHYGGIVSCKLEAQKLELRFDRNASEVFEVTGFSLPLHVDAESIERLKAGLRRIFPSDDRPAEFVL